MTKRIPFFAGFCILLCIACADTKSPTSTSTTESGNNEPASSSANSVLAETPNEAKIAQSQEPKSLASKDILYSWVDNLNIRETPNTNGKLVVAVQSTDALEFTGEKSDHIETFVLRGVAYDEPWLKVITPDKKEGWVFGGAVKRKEDSKGNAPLTRAQVDFPYFGNYDLSSWKNLGTKKEGDEVDFIITTFQKGNQILEITQSDIGEFHYGYTHKLMDANKKVLKERVLQFTSDSKELVETVKDYTSNPPKQYYRQQIMKKHFMQLNAKPLMVNGAWTESELE